MLDIFVRLKLSLPLKIVYLTTSLTTLLLTLTLLEFKHGNPSALIVIQYAILVFSVLDWN